MANKKELLLGIILGLWGGLLANLLVSAYFKSLEPNYGWLVSAVIYGAIFFIAGTAVLVYGYFRKEKKKR